MSPHLQQARRSRYDSRCALRMWIAEMDKWIKSCCNHSFAYYVYFKLLRRVKEGLRYNIANPRCCTFVQQLALSIFYTLLLKYIRSRLYLIIATTEVIVVPSDQLQTWLLSQCSVLRLFVKKKMFVKSSPVSALCQVQNLNHKMNPTSFVKVSPVIVSGDVFGEGSTPLWWLHETPLQMLLLVKIVTRLLPRGSALLDDRGHDPKKRTSSPCQSCQERNWKSVPELPLPA